MVATANETPTTRQKPSSAALFTSSVFRLVDWMNRSHTVESLKLSNAVLPNSTDTVATRPGTGGVASRLASGLRSTSVPSSRRPNTDSRPTSVE